MKISKDEIYSPSIWERLNFFMVVILGDTAKDLRSPDKDREDLKSPNKDREDCKKIILAQTSWVLDL